MKKQTNKLSLKTNTIRVLHDDQLPEVAGGAPTATCSMVVTCCSISIHACPTERCPPATTRHC